MVEDECRPKLGPKWAKPASKGGKPLARWLAPGRLGRGTLDAGDLEDHGGGNDGGRGKTPALHERGMDCGGRKRLKPKVGVPLLGSRSEEANRCGGPATVACGSTTIGGPADDARPQGRCHEELQDLTTRMAAQDQYKAEVLPFMVSLGPRGESSAICFNALRILSGSAIMKLIGVRVRPERGQEPQLIKQLKQSYMGTTFCSSASGRGSRHRGATMPRSARCCCTRGGAAFHECQPYTSAGEAAQSHESVLLQCRLSVSVLAG